MHLTHIFKKLLLNFEGIIAALGPPRPKTGSAASKNKGRDLFWSDLLAIWCQIGGKTTGKDIGKAADFLTAVSDPVSGHAARRTGRRPLSAVGHPMAEA